MKNLTNVLVKNYEKVIMYILSILVITYICIGIYYLSVLF